MSDGEIGGVDSGDGPEIGMVDIGLGEGGLGGVQDLEGLYESRADKLPVVRTPKPGKKYRQGRPKKNLLTAEMATTISDGTKEVSFPDVRKGGNASGKLRVEAIPKGPYAGKHDMYKALFQFQDINIQRSTLGINQIKDGEITKRTGMTALEIERVILSEEYRKFRLSKSASTVQQTIADVAPSLRIAVVEFMGQLKTIARCEACGRMGPQDLKKLHEGLQFVVMVMDKFGLPRIDTSLAENTDDMDTEKALEEGIRIVQEAVKWPNLAPQRIVRELLESGSPGGGTGKSGAAESGTAGKPGKTDKDTGTPANDAEPGPDEVVHTVRVPEAAVVQSQEVPGNGVVEPVGENGLADGGFHAVRTGETPEREDPQERDVMDFRGEERQDTTGS